MASLPKLDRIDINILVQLQNDGALTNVQLSERIGLSPSPCLQRVKRLERAVERLRTAPQRALEREGQRLQRSHERLRRAPALAVERKRGALEAAAGRLRALSPKATLTRGYAIVRTDAGVVRSSTDVTADGRVDVELAEGGFGARVEDVRHE